MIDLTRVHYWHSNSSTGKAGAGWGLWRSGWGGTLSAIKTARDLGITSTIIRGPEGDADGVYPLDFYLPTSLSRWLGVRAVRKLMADARKIGVSVSPYFGSLPESKDMKAHVENGEAGAWLWKVHETLRPWLDGGAASLMFDHVGVHGGPDDPSYYLLRTLQRLGVTVCGEPHGEPVYGLDGVIVNDEHWRRAWKKADFRDQFIGRVIRITSSLDDVQAILDDGHEAAVTWRVINQMGGGK